MKETGLMFKAPLVRAILAGQKTQTRRVVKWRDLQQGLNLGFSGLKVFSNTPGTFTLESQCRNGYESRSSPTRCPMGQPGDRIYVRETFGHFERNENFKPGCECFYRADGDSVELQPWRPAIHMPKWAARIWLEVTGVRVERLQQITEADCIAEGALGGHGAIPGYQYRSTPMEHFRHIWESTGGDWAANPWVWVIDFKIISTTGNPQ